MSRDLWSEFASQNSEENPWGSMANQGTHEQGGFDEDDFGDFQSAKPQRIKTNLGQATSGITNPSASMNQAHGPVEGLSPNSLYESSSHPSQYSLKEDQYLSPDARVVANSRNNAQTMSSELSFQTTPEAFNGRVEETLIMKPPAQDAWVDDEWGDFVEVPVSDNAGPSGMNRGSNVQTKAQYHALSSTSFSHSPTSAKATNSNPRNAVTQDHLPASTNQEPPPSNVPPPSILLLLISEIFKSLPTSITNFPVSTASSTDSPSSSSEIVYEIKKRLSIVRAAGRIIAGRKLRWKRDSRLSQSMKIGPANTGRAGGMKLTGIDRTETRREDGEVEEAVRRWKQQVGSLRAVVGTVNSREPGLRLAVPEISETMPVRLAKANEGAIFAPTCCFLCGVKRVERVEKIEMRVEDSFGEWWMDHWGHVDCKLFWDEQKKFLPRR